MLTCTEQTLVLGFYICSFLFPLRRMFLLGIFAFIVMDAVSPPPFPWDPSSELKDLLPSCSECCQQTALSCQCPWGAAPPKVMFPFWSSPHLMADYCRGRNACPPCPNLGQLWKVISTPEASLGLYLPMLLPLSPFRGVWSPAHTVIKALCANFHPESVSWGNWPATLTVKLSAQYHLFLGLTMPSKVVFHRWMSEDKHSCNIMGCHVTAVNIVGRCKATGAVRDHGRGH